MKFTYESDDEEDEGPLFQFPSRMRVGGDHQMNQYLLDFKHHQTNAIERDVANKIRPATSVPPGFKTSINRRTFHRRVAPSALSQVHLLEIRKMMQVNFRESL
ncbi:hypothetical protein HDU98_012031 [Podochytrium sp. JEL0797]|nr:hypothetical protein HDU98_012031 [Podochytrium sp. JEL0797]